MSENFAKKWQPKKDNSSFKLDGQVLATKGLKSKLELSIKKLDKQIAQLDQANTRFTQKDQALFTKLVDAYQQHDMPRANIYANELAEIRKMSKLLMNARLALDQVGLRIKTVTELGVSTLGPCIGVLRSVNAGMGGVLPAAENELGEIGDLLSGLMFEAGTSSGMSLNFNSVNEDASKILSEAAVVAEQKVSANFPDLPAGFASEANKSRT